MLSEATLFLVNQVAYVSNRAVYLIKPLRVGNDINFYIASIINIVLTICFLLSECVFRRGKTS